MDMYSGFKPHLQRYGFIFFVILVCVSAFLPSFWLIAFGKDFPIKATDKNDQSSNKKISLEEAIRIAVEKNPLLQSTRDQVEAALGLLRQSKLYPNPVLEFLAEEIPDNEIGLNQSQNLVAVTQPIITGGKRGLGIKVSEKSKEKNEFERDTVLLNVVADTKKAFYQIIGDQEGLAIARETEEIANGIYESEKLRFEAGEVAITNILRAEVELSKARNLVSKAEGNLQNSIKELQTVMGIPEEIIGGVTGKLLSRPGEVSLPELELKMNNNQPFLKASKKNIEVADTQLMLEKRQVIPDINVSAGYKRLSMENIDTVQLGVEIPAPFFNRNQGNIQKGKALSKKAKSENQSVYNELLFQLRRNFNSYNVERKRVIEYRDKILPKAEESLTLITRGYREGEFDYIDLLDAQRTWAETRISYIESLKSLNLFIADIERLAVTKIRER
ncbi:MAG: TolC family protein [Candidatus Brocadia sp. AMX2]|uniref:Metal ion efflux outer membrane protein n=1 Tax=Candidatus Brocadia sinica JPN1 TaxID=1197129 RepID=A0ABQ0K1G7_9BACT|nr:MULTISPECIES: TolC family protein [Brocadia]KXK30752.1 MAG: efflux transporter [Candidatus Brocadia sinica]MBC6932572.1 TolC family protein [Candidatus Brocadia sp.]MBL1168106.1 TolC family protein [Candidatus Brocadia sp. AMX1]NOG42687.1 TolC family protein [Planctomycetota bacterium]KAA0243965.1 MAG: TolC family protein [Candidatus Brocadia sp. AMX2]